MFAFNFEIPHQDDSVIDDAGAELLETRSTDPCSARVSDHALCEEVDPLEGNIPPSGLDNLVNGPSIGGVRLRYLSPDGIKASCPEFSNLDNAASDLVPGTYEGGFKVTSFRLQRAYRRTDYDLIFVTGVGMHVGPQLAPLRRQSLQLLLDINHRLGVWTRPVRGSIASLRASV